MRYSKSKYKEEIIEVISATKKVLHEREKGEPGESTIEQLRDTLLPELYNLLHIVESGKLPKADDRYLNSFANAFTVWGWSMENPTELFIKLTELNNNYKKL